MQKKSRFITCVIHGLINFMTIQNHKKNVLNVYGIEKFNKVSTIKVSSLKVYDPKGEIHSKKKE